MTIPALHVDNPIDRPAIPNQKLTTRLPAIGRPQSLGHLRTVSIAFSTFIVGATIQVAATTYFSPGWIFRTSLPPTLPSVESFLIAGFALAVFSRPLFRSSHYSILLAILAASTLCVTTAISIAEYPANDIRRTLVYAGLIALLAIELGFHFYVLASETVTNQGARRAQNELLFRNAIWQIFVAICVFMLLCLLVTPLIALWTLSVILFVLGVIQLKQRFRRPILAFQQSIFGFLFYPDNWEVAPSNIQTSSGSFISRFLLLGIVCGGLFVVAIGELSNHQPIHAIAYMLVPLALIIAIYVAIVSLVGHTIEIGDRPEAWRTIVRSMRESTNPIERNGLFFGHVAEDQSPVIVDRSLCFQHFHVLGATGNNKTSMALAPLVEQLVSFEDSSVIIIDLKADSPELYYAADFAVKELESRTGIQRSLKLFSMENGSRTHAYNPFLTTGWTDLSLLERSDILCTSCGLAYGFDYGRSFFTSANAAVIREANLSNPNAMSFRQLYKDVARLLEADSKSLLPELRRAGVHTMEVIGRLASYEELNVIPDLKYSDAVLDNQIQLADYFQKPGVAYFRLPSTTASIGAPSIARLILFFLVIAAKKQKRKTKVHVIVDEFQRMATENLDQLLQMARSHDIGLTLCNQSMSDLKANSPKVFHAVNGSCALRQWFSVNSNEDLTMMEHLMGTREELQVTRSTGKETSYSYRTTHVPRARITDLHKVSENPNLSILQLSGLGTGYGRYGGIPFVCESNYHISATEYQKRKNSPWPSDLEGMMDAMEVAHADPYTPKQTKKRQDPPSDGIDLNRNLFD